jgi:hypothetical protein
MRIFDAPKTFIESLAALTGHEELEPQAVSVFSITIDRFFAFNLRRNSFGKESRPVGANLPALGLSNKAVFEGRPHSFFLLTRINQISRQMVLYLQVTLPPLLVKMVRKALCRAMLTQVPHQPPFFRHWSILLSRSI